MVAVWAIGLLAATGGHLDSGRHTVPAAEMPAAVGVLTSGPDAAIIPARVAEEVRAAGQGAPLRVLVLTAMLAVLAGLPAALRRRTSSADGDHEPLRTRRHTIALRAPPLQFA